MTYPLVRVWIDFTSDAYDAATNWTNVTDYAERVTCHYGRSNFLDEFQPGSGSVTLINDDGRFDPENTSGPHYGNLLPRRRVKVDAVHNAVTYTIAYGWTDGWPVAQTFRTRSTVEVTWHDALSVLARAPLPDSVWDYLIASRSPYLWWKLGDETAVAQDHSGNGRHGRYIVYEGDTFPWVADAMPQVIVREGTVEDAIPTTGRAGKSWAKMQAEVGQPVGGPTGRFPRTPAIISTTPAAEILLDRVFTVECWVTARQAFPLDVTGGTASTTPMRQPIFTVGEALTGAWFEVGLSDDAEPYCGTWIPTDIWAGTGSWGELTFTTGSLADGVPHHLVFASTFTAGAWLVRCYLDGVDKGGVNLGNPGMVSTGWPVVVGMGIRDPDDRGLQSILGDIVLYDSFVTVGTAQDNYEAGALGSLSGSTLTAGEAVEQVLDMIGWAVATDIDPGGKTVTAGPMRDRVALDVMREFAEAERAPLYQAADGTITMLSSHWQVELARAKASQFSLGDASGDSLGYEALDFTFDDSSIINDCRVRYEGGEAHATNDTSIASYGLLARSLSTRLASADEALSLAEWVVAVYGDPRRRVDRPLSFRCITDADFELALSAEFGTRLTVARTTPDGRDVEDDYWVQSVAHRIEPGEGDWRVDLTLERADDPFRIFTVGSLLSGDSALDGTDVLAY